MTEIDYLLQLDSAGIVVYEDSSAALCQIKEWADTTIGTVWGDPKWGCPLDKYRHLPVSDDAAGIIESALAMKITEDLPDLSIGAILVTPIDVDTYQIKMASPLYADVLSFNKTVKTS